jgi:hypothetical protein
MLAYGLGVTVLLSYCRSTQRLVARRKPEQQTRQHCVAGFRSCSQLLEFIAAEASSRAAHVLVLSSNGSTVLTQL